ncbi:unnamed protein product [Arctia plantaginis]|uniref:MADF domain-containing protein n=1 Tax=Arctia plantaginis TaxID=874455 RepID=A0A8S0YNH5_ARCPL|nr:unnamed protein product [Arctia plantaginis]
MDVENNEVLIAMVFDRPALWDKKSKFYSSRKVVDKCRKEISLEMKQDDVVKPRVSRSKFASSFHADQDVSAVDCPSVHNNEFYASSSPINQDDDNGADVSKNANMELFQSPAKRCQKSYDDKILDIERRKLQILHFLQDLKGSEPVIKSSSAYDPVPIVSVAQPRSPV